MDEKLFVALGRAVELRLAEFNAQSWVPGLRESAVAAEALVDTLQQSSVLPAVAALVGPAMQLPQQRVRGLESWIRTHAAAARGRHAVHPVGGAAGPHGSSERPVDQKRFCQKSPTFGKSPRHFTKIPDLWQKSPTFAKSPRPLAKVPDLWQTSPTFGKRPRRLAKVPDIWQTLGKCQRRLANVWGQGSGSVAMRVTSLTHQIPSSGPAAGRLAVSRHEAVALTRCGCISAPKTSTEAVTSPRST